MFWIGYLGGCVQKLKKGGSTTQKPCFDWIWYYKSNPWFPLYSSYLRPWRSQAVSPPDLPWPHHPNSRSLQSPLWFGPCRSVCWLPHGLSDSSVFSRPLGFVYLVSWVQITGISFNFWPLECYKEIPLNWILNFKRPSAHRPRTRRAAAVLHPPHCQIFGDERILIAWADCPWDKPAAAPAVCHWWLCKFWRPRHDPIRGGKHMGFLTRGCTQTIHKIDQKSSILVLKHPISIYLHFNPMTKNGLRSKGVFWLINFWSPWIARFLKVLFLKLDLQAAADSCSGSIPNGGIWFLKGAARVHTAIALVVFLGRTTTSSSEVFATEHKCHQSSRCWSDPPTNSGIMDFNFNCNFQAKKIAQPRDQNHKQFERPNLLNPNFSDVEPKYEIALGAAYLEPDQIYSAGACRDFLGSNPFWAKGKAAVQGRIF